MPGIKSVFTTIIAASLAAVVEATSFLHDWATTADMTFADFRSPTILTDAQVAFAASKYRIVSLEKCSGINNGTMTEDFVYSTAKRLKATNPSVKVIFYLATDQQGLQCYRANQQFKAHPEWSLRDDDGNVLPFMDVTNEQARAWWLGIALGGVNGTGQFDGTPVTELVDGVLADGAGWSNIPNMSLARKEQLTDAKKSMVGDLQEIFSKANGGIVMANGISMYGGPNEDPRTPNDHNLKVLTVANAIMNEHTAAFECVNAHNASFNMDVVSRDLEAIIQAATWNNGSSKTVFVQTWPGLYAGVQTYPPVANGGEPTPTTNSEWRDALRSHFPFAHALFLSVAEANTYWFYGGTWYDSTTGYIACPENLDSCPAPPEWYPDLDKPLGKPLGPRVEIRPYTWTREFEHASVYLDLVHWNTSKVTFK